MNPVCCSYELRNHPNRAFWIRRAFTLDSSFKNEFNPTQFFCNFLNAFITVFILNKLKIPSIIGFLIAGILIGPHGLELIKDVHLVEIFAEIESFDATDGESIVNFHRIARRQPHTVLRGFLPMRKSMKERTAMPASTWSPCSPVIA